MCTAAWAMSSRNSSRWKPTRSPHRGPHRSLGTFARCKFARVASHGRFQHVSSPALMNPAPSKSKAALWMAGWLSLMLVMAVAGREATRELNVFQIMEVRTVLGIFLLYPLIHISGGFAILKTSRPFAHLVRNLIHYAAQLGWFFSLTLIPLGQLVSIEFTMPIWTAILAASFLRERMTIWKIIAIALGLVGVLVIVRPATGE